MTTVLYPLPLAYTAAGHPESLTHYVLRLSRAHCVTPAVLIRQLFGHYLPKPYLEIGYDKAIPYGAAINGRGVVAADWVRIISSLTSQRNLSAATLIGWAPVIPVRGLVAPHRRWCVRCYQSSHSIPYDPLYWTVAQVTTCAIHQTTLLDNCPACHAFQSWLPTSGVTEICHQCGTSLYTATPDTHPSSHDQWVTVTVAEALRNPPRVAAPLVLAQRLRESIEQLNHGIAAHFAHDLGYPKNTVAGWLGGGHQPTLEAVLRLCAVRNQSLTAYLRGDPLPPIEPDHTNAGIPPRVARCRRSPRSVKLDPSHIADATLSARQVAEQLGTSRRMLYYHQPEAARKRSQRRQRLSRQHRQHRQQQIERWMTQTVQQVTEAGIYPSQREIEARLPAPWSFREAAVRAAWHRALDAARDTSNGEEDPVVRPKE